MSDEGMWHTGFAVPTLSLKPATYHVSAIEYDEVYGQSGASAEQTFTLYQSFWGYILENIDTLINAGVGIFIVGVFLLLIIVM